MSRVFFRSFFTLFIWIILFANLLYAFNLMYMVEGFGFAEIGSGVDYSNSYFGFSSFLKVLQANPNTPLNWVLNETKKMIDYYQRQASEISNIDWSIAWSQIKNPVDFFKAVGDFFVNVGKSLLYIVVYIASLAITVIYVALVIVNFFWVVLQFFTGAYAIHLPNTYGGWLCI